MSILCLYSKDLFNFLFIKLLSKLFDKCAVALTHLLDLNLIPGDKIQDLANYLGKDLNDKIVLYSPIDQVYGFGIPPMKELIISGILFL